jgi:hypothetical protein
MNGDTIALLAHPGGDDDLGAIVRRTAAALARAAVSRGYRIVVHADAGALFAAALAAFEVRPPVTVEGGEALPPPLILWPSLPTEGVEEELFFGSNADERAGLLDLLTSMGMVDPSPFLDFRQGPRSGALFARLFESWRPSTVVALGPRWSLGPSIEGADLYRLDQGSVSLFLARGLSRGEPWTDQSWRDLESIVPRQEAGIEPTLFGEPVTDEALRGIARLASLESLLALAVERLAAGEVEGNAGEPEPSPRSPLEGGGRPIWRPTREKIKAGA